MSVPIDTLQLVIVSPDETLFDDQIKSVIVPGILQDLAILPHHTPLYSQLSKGDVRITPVTGSVKTLPIEGGIIRVKLNRVSILIGFDTRETLFQPHS